MFGISVDFVDARTRRTEDVVRAWYANQARELCGRCVCSIISITFVNESSRVDVP